MNFYGWLYRQVFWRGYEMLLGRQTYRLWQTALQRQWWPPERLAEWQQQELGALLAHARAQSEWHRPRLAAAGLAGDGAPAPAAWHRLTPMTKQDILTHRATIRCRTAPGRVYEHRTGGSTGAPLRFDVNYASYEWRVAVTLRGYGWAGCADGDRQFYVWGAPIGTPPLTQRVKTKLHNAALRRQVFSSFGFSEPAMDECLRRLNRFRPRTVVGYTTALCLLAQRAQATGWRIRPPAAVITAAEGVNAVQRAAIEAAFGAPVFASYGSREFMLIAMECEQHHGLHVSADNLFVEVVRPDGTPCAEGELGEILITDLHNYALPFIRYQIGDLGVLSDRVCPCGRGLPLLERVEGRVLDVIRTPHGRVVPGEFFPHLFKEFDGIKQFQVVQPQLDRLVIKLVWRDCERPDQRRQLETEIRKTMGDSIQLEFQNLPEIPQTSSGKFRVTVSELEAANSPSPRP